MTDPNVPGWDVAASRAYQEMEDQIARNGAQAIVADPQLSALGVQIRGVGVVQAQGTIIIVETQSPFRTARVVYEGTPASAAGDPGRFGPALVTLVKQAFSLT